MRKFDFEIGEYYHLYSRGNDKRLIFTEDDDYQRFVCSLYASNTTEVVHLSDLGQWSVKVWKYKPPNTLVDIGAYCLMPNHFHLLVREKVAHGITRFMRKHLTGYSKYFNIKHSRTGKLFEGAFKATHLENDRYLQYLYAYIHLNPVKTSNPDDWPEMVVKNPNLAREFLDKYPYSSYQDYQGISRPESAILHKISFPKYFSNRLEFEQFLVDWTENTRTT